MGEGQHIDVISYTYELYFAGSFISHNFMLMLSAPPDPRPLCCSSLADPSEGRWWGGGEVRWWWWGKEGAESFDLSIPWTFPQPTEQNKRGTKRRRRRKHVRAWTCTDAQLFNGRRERREILFTITSRISTQNVCWWFAGLFQFRLTGLTVIFAKQR